MMSKSKLYEENWVERFQAGEESALNELFLEFHQRLIYFATNYLDDEMQSEEIVIDIFLKAWERRTNFETFLNVKAFLYISTKNKCFDLYKHLQRKRPKEKQFFSFVSTEETLQADHAIIQTELIHMIHTALSSLPTQCKKVAELAFFDQIRNEEIAKKLGVSINTVKTQKARARIHFRNWLKELM